MAYGSSTVDRAIDVLSAITASPGGLSNADLCEKLDIDRSATHRILTTLDKRGLITRIDGRRFVGGPALMLLATGTLQSPCTAAEPILTKLVELTGESASLSILSGQSFACIAHRSSPHELSYSPITGKHYPLHTGAAGLALWAFQPDAVREKLMSAVALVAVTSKTITDVHTLRAELDAIVERGFAHSSGVRTPGGCSISVPVYGIHHTVTSALALSAADVRMPLDRLKEFAPDLKAFANELGHALGGTS